MICTVYGRLTQSLFAGEVNWLSGTVKVALCTSSYAPNQDTHRYMSDVTNELAGGGYARQTVTGKTATYVDGTNTLTLDCNDVTFTALTATGVRYAPFFIDTGVAATSPLLCVWDFETGQNPAGQDLKLTISASGLLTVTV